MCRKSSKPRPATPPTWRPMNDETSTPQGRLLTATWPPRDPMDLLTILVVVLVVLWLGGYFAFHIAGGLIHLLLVVAAVVLVIRLLQGRRAP